MAGARRGESNRVEGDGVSRRRERFFEVLERARARRGVALMGICNVTPDSFSDGGRYFPSRARRRRIDELLAEGADIVDIGGESTRPGAVVVPADEQLARVLEVVRYAADARGVRLDRHGAAPRWPPRASTPARAWSTTSPASTTTRSRASPRRTARRSILMHARGPQSEMTGFSAYPDDAYGDVVDGRRARSGPTAAERAMRAGSRATRSSWTRPRLRQERAAEPRAPARARRARARLGVPVLVGASRKSFLAVVDRDATPTERLGASIAAALHAARERRRASSASTTCARPPGPRPRALARRPSAAAAASRQPERRVRGTGDLMLEGLLHLFARAAALAGRHRRPRHPPRHLRRLPRAPRPPRHARDADGDRARRHLPRLRRRQVGGASSRCTTCSRRSSSSIILIVVVVFQNDIRRGLMRVGARAFFGGIAAAAGVARHRRGGGGGDRARAPPHGRAHLLRAGREPRRVRRRAGDDRSTRSVQRELLVGLFVPESVNKLHDGAVVIRNLRIAKAGVFFPMPDTKVLDKSLGSRHRAALGITEETDAVVVVVSRGARDDQLLLQRQHRLEPRRRVAPPGAPRPLRPARAEEEGGRAPQAERAADRVLPDHDPARRSPARVNGGRERADRVAPGDPESARQSSDPAQDPPPPGAADAAGHAARDPGRRVRAERGSVYTRRRVRAERGSVCTKGDPGSRAG